MSSYIPRVERQYTDFYPNLDLDAELDITTVKKGGTSPHSTDKLTQSVLSVGYEVSKGPSGLSELHPSETTSSQFNVSGRIGGVGPSARYLPLKHGFPIPKPSVRNQKVLDSQLGYVGTESKWHSHDYVRPDATMDAYRPFTTISPQDPLRLEKQVSELAHIEYRMDDTDLGILGFLSLRYGELMEPEIFEVVMSMLDLSAALICLKMFPRQRQSELQQRSASSVLLSESTHHFQDAHPPKDLLDLEDNRSCAVCSSANQSDANIIVFCDGCDVAVHQDCYGVPAIPEGQWLCRRCESAGIGAEVDCILCPQRSGAFKQTLHEDWIHLVCALWTPIVRVPEESSLMEPIMDSDYIEKDRFTLNCYVCRQKSGSCLQCASRDCYQSFHATCAQIAGFYMTNYDHDIEEMLHHQANLPVYCHRHSSGHIPRDRQPNLEAARKLLAEEQEKQNSPGRSLFAVRKHKYWRTPNGTLILPRAVVDAVLVALKTRLDIHIPRHVIEFMCRYWTMKKDNAGGVMFDRRLTQALEIAQHCEIRAEQSEEPEKQPEELVKVVDELLAVLQPVTSDSQKKRGIAAINSDSKFFRKLRKTRPSRN